MSHLYYRNTSAYCTAIGSKIKVVVIVAEVNSLFIVFGIQSASRNISRIWDVGVCLNDKGSTLAPVFGDEAFYMG